MLKKILIPLFLQTASLFALNEFNPPMHQEEPKEILLNNRVLLKINGKVISLLDVVRKMDYLFYQNYPQLASSIQARYQFYTINWKAMLNSVIDDQLIMEDAKEKKIDTEIKDGDIRETMEGLFGPDVVMTLDKMGLHYDEAWELIKTELTVRQMNGMMVRSRAQNEVNPKEVKKLYEKIVSQTPIQNTWIYQTLTIESKEAEKGKSVSDKAAELLASQKVQFSDLPSLLKGDDESITVRISEEFERKDKELSPSHKAILQTLAIGTHSTPIFQASKKEGINIFRIFHLKKCEMGKKIALQEIEAKISKELMEKAMERYGVAYTEKLRKHYGITNDYLSKMIPENFEPFVLR